VRGGGAATLGAPAQAAHWTGVGRRLADMATAARSLLELGIDNLLEVRNGVAHRSAEGRPGGQVARLGLVLPVVAPVDARAPDRVVEEQLSEIALRLSCLKACARRDGYVGVSGRNLQLVQASNLFRNESPQLCGAVALSARDPARQGNKQQPERSRAGHLLDEQMLGLRRWSSS